MTDDMEAALEAANARAERLAAALRFLKTSDKPQEGRGETR